MKEIKVRLNKNSQVFKLRKINGKDKKKSGLVKMRSSILWETHVSKGQAKGFQSDVGVQYRKDTIKKEDHNFACTNNVIM